MNIKLDEVPFSAAGSYIALGLLDENFHGWGNEAGLYLRTVHVKGGNTTGSSSLVARMIPKYQGEEIPCTVTATPAQMLVQTRKGRIRIAFDDETTLLVKGEGEGLSMTLDFCPLQGTSAFMLIERWQEGERVWDMANCFRSSVRFMLHTQEGHGTPEQNWIGETSTRATYTAEAVDGTFLLAIQEVVDSWKDAGKTYDIDAASDNMARAFADFCRIMPSVPETLRETGEYASYVNWSAIVAPSGLFHRYAMYMSKNWMTSVWSWDHCFNAIACAYGDPDMAWDQLMVMFDHQRPSGMIPDSINDAILLDNYCKPPIHGWAYRKMSEIMEISEERKREVYDKLSRWTNWWLTYRDPNGDGLCEYTHGNDSGWDNSTAFVAGPPMTLPDLAAFLVLQMEELSRLARQLGREDEAVAWQEKADAHLARMLEVLFPDNAPVGRQAFTQRIVPTDSLILCLPIVLGDSLPAAAREKILERLRRCETEWGFATEQPDSPLYESDGYWRGPIWAPSTMLILDGLSRSGEAAWAREKAAKFCDMVAKSGCAENFDAITGDGLRDRAYTWTASVMLVLAHEYLG